MKVLFLTKSEYNEFRKENSSTILKVTNFSKNWEEDFFQLETKSDERGDEGLYNTFMENFPITDTRNNFVLEFLDYFVDPPRYTIQECIERGLTYSVPLKARLKLYCTDPEHEDFETIGGIIISEFERLPQINESIDLAKWRFTILAADLRMISVIKVEKIA